MNSIVRGLTILWKSCKIHRSSRIVLSEESWSADSLKIGKLWRVLQRILDGGAGGGVRDMGGGGPEGVNGCPSPHSCPQSGLNNAFQETRMDFFKVSFPYKGPKIRA